MRGGGGDRDVFTGTRTRNNRLALGQHVLNAQTRSVYPPPCGHSIKISSPPPIIGSQRKTMVGGGGKGLGGQGLCIMQQEPFRVRRTTSYQPSVYKAVVEMVIVSEDTGGGIGNDLSLCMHTHIQLLAECKARALALSPSLATVVA